MILLDLDKRITIFAPGRVGSTSLSETIHPFTTNSHMTSRQSDNFLTPIISQTPIPPNYYNMLESCMNMNMSIVNVYMFIRKVFSKDFDKHYVIIRDPVDRFISGCEMLLQLSGKDDFLQFYNDMTKDKFANLKGKTITYEGSKWDVIDSNEFTVELKNKDNKTKTVNFKQFTTKGLVERIIKKLKENKIK